MGRVLLATGTMETSDNDELQATRMGEVDESNDRHMRASVDFVNFSQCNEGTPSESDSLATRGGVLVESV